MASRIRGTKKSGFMSALTAGVPLITLLVGGSYILSTFMETHYEVKDKRTKSVSTRKFDLEEEHTKMMKSLNIDDYKLSRIPRVDDVEADKLKQRMKGKGSGGGAGSSSSSSTSSTSTSSSSGASPSAEPAGKKGWLW